MKKLGYWLLSVLLAVICVCAVVGCGGSKAGVYKFQSMEVTDLKGETKTLKVGDKYDLVLGLSFEVTEDLYKLELKEDGTFAISVGQNLPGATSGTWKENESDSGKIDLTPGGTVECKGGKITMTIGSNKVVLKK